jgi:hypothetical protein
VDGYGTESVHGEWGWGAGLEEDEGDHLRRPDLWAVEFAPEDDQRLEKVRLGRVRRLCFAAAGERNSLCCLRHRRDTVVARS